MKAQFDMNGEIVNRIELSLNTTEALVLLCALHDFSNSSENAEADRKMARKMVDDYVEAIAGASMTYKIGDKRVFYDRDYRDKKADELEKMGYRIERYDGLSNYFFKILGVPPQHFS